MSICFSFFFCWAVCHVISTCVPNMNWLRNSLRFAVAVYAKHVSPLLSKSVCHTIRLMQYVFKRTCMGTVYTAFFRFFTSNVAGMVENCPYSPEIQLRIMCVQGKIIISDFLKRLRKIKIDFMWRECEPQRKQNMDIQKYQIKRARQQCFHF